MSVRNIIQNDRRRRNTFRRQRGENIVIFRYNLSVKSIRPSVIRIINRRIISIARFAEDTAERNVISGMLDAEIVQLISCQLLRIY